MKIEVQLHTVLQRQTPQGIQRQVWLELPPGSRLADVLRALEIKLTTDNLLLVVNGRVVDEAYLLTDGDQISLIPAMSGGGA